MDIQGWTVGLSLFYETLNPRGSQAYTAPPLPKALRRWQQRWRGFLESLLIKIKAIYADGNNPKTSLICDNIEKLSEHDYDS